MITFEAWMQQFKKKDSLSWFFYVLACKNLQLYICYKALHETTLTYLTTSSTPPSGINTIIKKCPFVNKDTPQLILKDLTTDGIVGYALLKHANNVIEMTDLATVNAHCRVHKDTSTTLGYNQIGAILLSAVSFLAIITQKTLTWEDTIDSRPFYKKWCKPHILVNQKSKTHFQYKTLAFSFNYCVVPKAYFESYYPEIRTLTCLDDQTLRQLNKNIYAHQMKLITLHNNRMKCSLLTQKNNNISEIPETFEKLERYRLLKIYFNRLRSMSFFRKIHNNN